jgi:polyhydroxyalkanoate synthesis regulator phasin
MAKKSTKKVELEKQVEAIENSENKVNVDELNITTDDVVKSLEDVSLEIESKLEENINNIINEATKELTPIKEITEEIANLGTQNEELNKKLASSSIEEITEFVNDEIKKAEEIQSKLEKISEKPKTVTGFSSVTNWWNGMGYDF